MRARHSVKDLGFGSVGRACRVNIAADLDVNSPGSSKHLKKPNKQANTFSPTVVAVWPSEM